MQRHKMQQVSIVVRILVKLPNNFNQTYELSPRNALDKSTMFRKQLAGLCAAIPAFEQLRS